MLAGGQTLLASMKLRLANPETLVDLGGIAELVGIRREGNAVVIGAMTRHADVAASADVKSALPALAELAGGIGDRQVRAMGRSAARSPTTTRPPVIRRASPERDDPDHQRKIAADDFFRAIRYGLGGRRRGHGRSFPLAKKAAYIKFKQPASRFAMIGVCVAQTDSGVAPKVTGGGNWVFRHQGWNRHWPRLTPDLPRRSRSTAICP